MTVEEDTPIQMNANYRFNREDRRYIDDQIRELQREVGRKTVVEISSSGTLNNVATTNAHVMRFTGAAPVITGLDNGEKARHVDLLAVTGDVVLKNNSTDSGASNRILTGTGSQITIKQGSGVTLVYDNETLRWRVTGDGAGFTAPSGSGLLSVVDGVLQETALELAAGVAEFLADPSSAKLATAVTDETGTGKLVFNTSPLFETSIKVKDDSGNYAYTIDPGTLIANRTIYLPDLTADSTIMMVPAGSVTGDILKYNGANWVSVPIGTAYQCLRVNAGASAPEWATLPAGSAGQLQGTDGSGRFTAPTNVLAGANYISIGSPAASAGSVRLANTASLQFRNAADDNDIYGLLFTSGDWLYIGQYYSYGATTSAGRVRVGAVDQVDLLAGGNVVVQVKAAEVAVAQPLRLVNTGQVTARNNADTYNIGLIAKDASDYVYVGRVDGSYSANTTAAEVQTHAVVSDKVYIAGSYKFGIYGAYASSAVPLLGESASPYGAHGMVDIPIPTADETVSNSDMGKGYWRLYPNGIGNAAYDLHVQNPSSDAAGYWKDIFNDTTVDQACNLKCGSATKQLTAGKAVRAWFGANKIVFVTQPWTPS